jgi:serine/threonine protein kinase
LAEALEDRGNDIDFCMKCFQDVLKAVTKLHEAQMTHGDLKANNLVCTTTDNPEGTEQSLMVVDFGSSWKSDLPHTFYLTTVTILDPEQAFGTVNVSNGQGGDIYALTLVLIQLLNKGTSLSEMMKYALAPFSFREYMKGYWKTFGSILDFKATEVVKNEIVDNLWRYIVFSYTKDEFVLNWIKKTWQPLRKYLSRLIQDRKELFDNDTGLYSLQFGTETATIRANKIFSSEHEAVWSLLSLLHPISAERTTLQVFSDKLNFQAYI